MATQKLLRPSVAQVCVEINLQKPLPRRIWIGQGEEGFWQSVVYEDLPPYCAACEKIGHSVGDCGTPEATNPPPKTKFVWRPKQMASTVKNPAPPEYTSGLTDKNKASIPVDLSTPIIAVHDPLIVTSTDSLNDPTQDGETLADGHAAHTEQNYQPSHVYTDPPIAPQNPSPENTEPHQHPSRFHTDALPR